MVLAVMGTGDECMSIKEIHHCESCGTCYGVEKHHIVFKKQNVLMINIDTLILLTN